MKNYQCSRYLTIDIYEMIVLKYCDIKTFYPSNNRIFCLFVKAFKQTNYTKRIYTLIK